MLFRSVEEVYPKGCSGIEIPDSVCSQDECPCCHSTNLYREEPELGGAEDTILGRHYTFNDARVDVECQDCEEMNTEYYRFLTSEEGGVDTFVCGSCGSTDVDTDEEEAEYVAGGVIITSKCNACGVKRKHPYTYLFKEKHEDIE